MRRRPQQVAQAHQNQSMSDLVLTEDRDAVRHVILNRPEKRNAFNLELVRAVGAALRAAADDPSVRVVVLRGNGPVFSAGMDIADAGRGGVIGVAVARRSAATAWTPGTWPRRCSSRPSA